MASTRTPAVKRKVITANYGHWFAAWEYGAPYIEVFGNSGPSMAKVRRAFERGENVEGSVHVISTAGDSWGGNDAQHTEYVRNELIAWAAEDGEIYRENGWR